MVPVAPYLIEDLYSKACGVGRVSHTLICLAELEGGRARWAGSKSVQGHSLVDQVVQPLVLMMEKLRPRDVRWLVQGHMVRV